MTDLRVDYERLEQSSSQLETVKRAVDDLVDNVNDASDEWGDSKISGAMHTFATNWGYHRKKLSNKIEDGKQKIEKTLTEFQKVDKDLAKSITGNVKVSK